MAEGLSSGQGDMKIKRPRPLPWEAAGLLLCPFLLFSLHPSDGARYSWLLCGPREQGPHTSRGWCSRKPEAAWLLDDWGVIAPAPQLIPSFPVWGRRPSRAAALPKSGAPFAWQRRAAEGLGPVKWAAWPSSEAPLLSSRSSWFWGISYFPVILISIK